MIFLSARAFDPSLVGPTLSPIPQFTLPTGPTGATSFFSFVATGTAQTVTTGNPFTFNTVTINGPITLTSSNTINVNATGTYVISYGVTTKQQHRKNNRFENKCNYSSRYNNQYSFCLGFSTNDFCNNH